MNFSVAMRGLLAGGRPQGVGDLFRTGYLLFRGIFLIELELHIVDSEERKARREYRVLF